MEVRIIITIVTIQLIVTGCASYTFPPRCYVNSTERIDCYDFSASEELGSCTSTRSTGDVLGSGGHHEYCLEPLSACAQSMDEAAACIFSQSLGACCEAMAKILVNCDDSGEGLGLTRDYQYFDAEVSTPIKTEAILTSVTANCPFALSSCLAAEMQRRRCLASEALNERDRPPWSFAKGTSRCCDETKEFLDTCYRNFDDLILATEQDFIFSSYNNSCSQERYSCTVAERKKQECVKDSVSILGNYDMSCCPLVAAELRNCVENPVEGELPRQPVDSATVNKWLVEATESQLTGIVNSSRSAGILVYEHHRDCTASGLACSLSLRRASECNQNISQIAWWQNEHEQLDATGCCQEIIDAIEDCQYGGPLASARFIAWLASLRDRNCQGNDCRTACVVRGLSFDEAAAAEAELCPVIYRYAMPQQPVDNNTCFGSNSCFHAAVPISLLPEFAPFLKKLSIETAVLAKRWFVEETEYERERKRISSGFPGWTAQWPYIEIRGCGGGLVCNGPIPTNMVGPPVANAVMESIHWQTSSSEKQSLLYNCCNSSLCNLDCPELVTSTTSVTIAVGETVEVMVTSSRGLAVPDGIVTSCLQANTWPKEAEYDQDSGLFRWTPQEVHFGLRVEFCFTPEREECLLPRTRRKCFSVVVLKCVQAVRRGQSLSSLASRWNFDWLLLWLRHGERGDAEQTHTRSLLPGTRIQLGQIYTATRGDTVATVAKRFGMAESLIKLLNRDICGTTLQPAKDVCVMPYVKRCMSLEPGAACQEKEPTALMSYLRANN